MISRAHLHIDQASVSRTCSQSFIGFDGAHAVDKHLANRSQLLQNLDFAYRSLDLGCSNGREDFPGPICSSGGTSWGQETDQKSECKGQSKPQCHPKDATVT